MMCTFLLRKGQVLNGSLYTFHLSKASVRRSRLICSKLIQNPVELLHNIFHSAVHIKFEDCH